MTQLAPDLVEFLVALSTPEGQAIVTEEINREVLESIRAVAKPAILPKHWVPKNEYVEISRGVGLDYQERIILRSDVQPMIMLGWQITRLTKVSKSMMHAKWKNAIIAMEPIQS